MVKETSRVVKAVAIYLFVYAVYLFILVRFDYAISYKLIFENYLDVIVSKLDWHEYLRLLYFTLIWTTIPTLVLASIILLSEKKGE